MGTVLSIIAVVVLLALLAVSVKRQREIKAAEKQARADAGEAGGQHEESLRRRAGVRAAHAERTETAASDAGAQRVGFDTDE
jgi:F0F1-type ATP synthase membrane subunit b/b'